MYHFCKTIFSYRHHFNKLQRSTKHKTDKILDNSLLYDSSLVNTTMGNSSMDIIMTFILLFQSDEGFQMIIPYHLHHIIPIIYCILVYFGLNP